MTIEGELDDISGLGQTRAAHDLCTGIPDDRKRHLTVDGRRPLRHLQRPPLARDRLPAGARLHRHAPTPPTARPRAAACCARRSGSISLSRLRERAGERASRPRQRSREGAPTRPRRRRSSPGRRVRDRGTDRSRASETTRSRARSGSGSDCPASRPGAASSGCGDARLDRDRAAGGDAHAGRAVPVVGGRAHLRRRGVRARLRAGRDRDEVAGDRGRASEAASAGRAVAGGPRRCRCLLPPPRRRSGAASCVAADPPPPQRPSGPATAVGDRASGLEASPPETSARRCRRRRSCRSTARPRRAPLRGCRPTVGVDLGDAVRCRRSCRGVPSVLKRATARKLSVPSAT